MNYLAEVHGILEDWAVGDHSHFAKENSEEECEENDEDNNNGDEDGKGYDGDRANDGEDDDVDNDKDGKLLLGQKLSFAPYSLPTK